MAKREHHSEKDISIMKGYLGIKDTFMSQSYGNVFGAKE